MMQPFKPLTFLLLIFISATTMARVTPVTPELGDPRINELLNAALPGDTLLFLPGTYRGPYLLDKVHGAENLPVVIRGIKRELVVIDGQSSPGMYLDHQAFLLRDCSWITIENFTIRNCWTDLVRAEDVSYLTLRMCDMTGGKRALFATGRGSHHFLVEGCSWQQDERVWTHAEGYSWEELHHGIHSHYNGSIFQGSGISGVFVVRYNFVRNTFNAFRLSQINDGEMDLLACTNGEVYRNTVYNTSDNVFEPEVHALNLHYYHNVMVNSHAFISITEVGGGEIYIYGNTAVSLPDCEDGWTVFKISSTERALTRPMYIYNNSWQVDFDIIGSPGTNRKDNHIRHFNNAAFSEQSDTFGIYALGEENHFDYDCSNVPFPGLLTGNGFEANGVVADPLFTDPYNLDFRLKPGSPCIDRGVADAALITGFAGARPDIGAYDNGELITGPPFRYASPEAEVPYREMPRITRHTLAGDTLTLWFSMPLEERSLEGLRFRIVRGDRSAGLELSGVLDGGYGLQLTPPEGMAGMPDPERGHLRLMISGWPLGENGMRATSWASSIPVSLFEPFR